MAPGFCSMTDDRSDTILIKRQSEFKSRRCFRIFFQISQSCQGAKENNKKFKRDEFGIAKRSCV